MELLADDDVSIVCAGNDQDDVKQKIPEGTAQVDFVTLMVKLYFDTLLRYVFNISDTLWRSCFQSYGSKDPR